MSIKSSAEYNIPHLTLFPDASALKYIYVGKNTQRNLNIQCWIINIFQCWRKKKKRIKQFVISSKWECASEVDTSLCRNIWLEAEGVPGTAPGWEMFYFVWRGLKNSEIIILKWGEIGSGKIQSNWETHAVSHKIFTSIIFKILAVY